jgi:NAD(P)-dependent dehydrogenase (short-subunit alcohol dehydrogenase family)
MAENQLAFVVGAGPGLGEALCRRFATAGLNIGAARRNAKALNPLIEELKGLGVEARGYACDAREKVSVDQTFALLEEDLGIPDLVVYNVGSFVPGAVLDIAPEAFEDCWRRLCYGALLIGQRAAGRMVARGSGAILFTGATAALRGGGGFANLAVGKFGLRALAQSMARELGPKGVHVAHFVIDGIIGTPSAEAVKLDPNDIAEAYYAVYRQPRSAWTQEMDLRPAAEKF